MLINAALVLGMLLPGTLGQRTPVPSSAQSDLSWIRSFTVPAETPIDHQERQASSDPRFLPLLRASLHQHQFFWHDHGKFIPLPDLIQLFIGIQGEAVLENQRYAAIDGCVPHDCGTRGMLWIDTQSKLHPALIFVATDLVSGGGPKEGSLVHLWLFSSTRLNWQQLPPSFTSSMGQWWSRTSKAWIKYYPEQVVFVSLVQPSGEIVSLSPELFHFMQSSAVAEGDKP